MTKKRTTRDHLKPLTDLELNILKAVYNDCKNGISHVISKKTYLERYEKLKRDNFLIVINLSSVYSLCPYSVRLTKEGLNFIVSSCEEQHVLNKN